MFMFSPMISLICTMLAIVACPIIIGRGVRPITTVAVIGIMVTFYFSLRVFSAVPEGGMSGWSPGGPGGMLIVDTLSAGFQIFIVVFLSAIVWLWWMGSSAGEKNAPEFFILLLGSALGMMMMASSLNLLLIVIALETASLPSYAIVGFDKRDRIGAEASLKYMIFGAVCVAIMLYGASLLYGVVGSLNFADIARYTFLHITVDQNWALLVLGLLCFFCGIAFKISAVPFHFWCPDAFEGARIEVTTWLSVASKAAGLVLLMRLVLTLCAGVDYAVAMSLLGPLAWTIAIVAAVTCTVGNLSAYKQQSVKRLLAYSSIAHAGYMMMAAAIFLHPSHAGSESGLIALLVYLIIYAFMNLGAFGVTAMVIWDSGSDKLEAFTGLARRAPWLAVPMVICLMSLVGLPPFAGFIGKWWILVALGGLGSTLGWFLVIVTVGNTLISLYYYMRIVVQMTLKDDGQPAVRSPLGGIALVNLCGVALLALFIFAQPLRTTAEKMAHGLYQAVPSAVEDGKVANAIGGGG